ncbi:tyrosine-type recombinase/integrase [Paenibacillus polymyxa]|uniref:tyrosine-type recombinase/integrase n=1 Tax=Paenibacillus polymyxa TaxID=1406 RepID=UPI001ABABB42|nr:tyrosine-type recombinase/integrase [Paenibacillus polymyxa]MBO3283107.1 tyrosine-type recombinase/integrase [Paenibacillus polymyxa]
MSVDPRKGKAVTAKRRSGRSGKEVGFVGLDLGFDLFFNAKRAEKLRTRTLEDYQSYWSYFREWLMENHSEIDEVGQLDTAILREYMNYMSYERTKYDGVAERRVEGCNLSPVTVASRLRALKTMCKFWMSEGLMSEDPAEKLKPPRKDTEEKSVIVDEQLRALIEAADVDTFAGFRDRTIMRLLADTGLRINEALRLESTHLDIASRCIRLPGHMNKNRKPRIVPVSASVLRELVILMEENRTYFDTDFIFLANYGEPLKADQFRKRLSQYADKVGIDRKVTPVSPHRFRDYFCTNYLLNGGDLFTLQRIVAHADIKTTQGYVKINEEAMRDSHSQYSPLSRLGMSRVGKRR